MTALIFGGAASGKSAYAEELICRLPRRGPLVYLASMDPLSGGGERIRRHRALRAGKGFVTVERPRGLAGCPLPAGSAVLLEDLDNRDTCLRLRRLVEQCLTEREADIIRRRYGLRGTIPKTQRELAAEYGISRSYVSRRR